MASSSPTARATRCARNKKRAPLPQRLCRRWGSGVLCGRGLSACGARRRRSAGGACPSPHPGRGVPRPPSISWQPWSGAKARSESYPLQCRRAMEASCAKASALARSARRALRALRRVAVHGGVVIPVVAEEQVVLVLPEELLRARVDLVHGVQDVVVHRPVQEDLGERAARGGDDGRGAPLRAGRRQRALSTRRVGLA